MQLRVWPNETAMVFVLVIAGTAGCLNPPDEHTPTEQHSTVEAFCTQGVTHYGTGTSPSSIVGCPLRLSGVPLGSTSTSSVPENTTGLLFRIETSVLEPTSSIAVELARRGSPTVWKNLTIVEGQTFGEDFQEDFDPQAGRFTIHVYVSICDATLLRIATHSLGFDAGRIEPWAFVKGSAAPTATHEASCDSQWF